MVFHRKLICSEAEETCLTKSVNQQVTRLFYPSGPGKQQLHVWLYWTAVLLVLTHNEPSLSCVISLTSVNDMGLCLTLVGRQVLWFPSMHLQMRNCSEEAPLGRPGCYCRVWRVKYKLLFSQTKLHTLINITVHLGWIFWTERSATNWPFSFKIAN